MLQTVTTLVSQTLVMFILAGIGFLLFKGHKITLEASKSLGNILIYIVLPSVIIKGFLVERTAQRLMALGISALAAAVTLGISVLISRLLFKKDPISHFASSFSNPGFFGVPLIIASISQGAIFYIAFFVGLLNLLQWTYGVAIMTGEKGSLKGLVKAPFFYAIVIGLVLFFTQLPLSKIVTSALTSLTNLNTPLAMFTVGIYLAQTNPKTLFGRKETYLVCLSRLVIIPLACIPLLAFIPSGFTELKLAVLLAISCPVGSNVAVYAQLHQKDYGYAVETVVLSTLFSLASIPLVQALGLLVF